MSDQPPVTPQTYPSRAERLNNLRFGREHGKLLLGSGVGWALDAIDVGLISYIMAALAVEWQLGTHRCMTSSSHPASPAQSQILC